MLCKGIIETIIHEKKSGSKRHKIQQKYTKEMDTRDANFLTTDIVGFTTIKYICMIRKETQLYANNKD